MLKATHIYMTACKLLSCLCKYDMWDAQVYVLENTVRPIPNMLPGMMGAVKHSSGLVRVWAPGAHEKEDERDDAWGAVPASVEEGDGEDGSPEGSDVSDDDGDGGDDGDGCDGELELLLGAVTAGEEPALQRMWVTRWLLASGRRLSISTWAVVMRHMAVVATCPPVPDPVALPAVPAPGADSGSRSPWWEDVL